MTKRITIIIADPTGTPHTVFSIGRNDILHCQYNCIKGHLQIHLRSSMVKGVTEVEPVQNVKVESKPDHEGKMQKQKIPTGAFTTRELFYMEGENDRFQVSRDEDVIRIWDWINEGNSEEEVTGVQLIQMKKDILDQMELARKAAEERQKQTEENAVTADDIMNKNTPASEPGKLVSLDGKPL